MNPKHDPNASMLIHDDADLTTREIPTVPGPVPPTPLTINERRQAAGLDPVTVGLPVIRTYTSHLRRYAVPLAAIILILTFIAGGAVGYGVGKDKVAKGNANVAGWLLTSATVNGAAISTTETVYLSWDIAQTPHDLGAVWYIVNPANAKHSLVAAIPLDAASNGQGGITITLHTAGGDIVITGTLSGNTLQVVIPPDSHLFPAAPNAFVTLTFAPSNSNAFNQLVAGGA
jgi:hypothetical protein